jgi:hypothetical protein
MRLMLTIIMQRFNTLLDKNLTVAKAYTRYPVYSASVTTLCSSNIVDVRLHSTNFSVHKSPSPEG